jgi:5-methyltetrahydropteroyltriglutamate--homocysteine methyltransferase
MMTAGTIETTLVGSYPIPQWLVAHPSEQGLRDATAVVLCGAGPPSVIRRT